ncbi:cyclase-like protein 3 isoform X2 [Elaeis guineensis]|uniref:cyclase-like protein 3 isoform X2 n=1 Tax=Elaeis guineensis var. tenera TaxID=51953 RepID=UPI003C6CF513
MGRIITLGPTVLFPLLLQLFSLAADRAAGGDADLVVVRREEYGGGRILDITHAYREDMPTWESDKGAGQFLWLPKSMKNGSLANFSELRMSVPTAPTWTPPATSSKTTSRPASMLTPSASKFSMEIILLEGLKLDNIKPGIYSLHCLPLRLLGAEGSPTR